MLKGKTNTIIWCRDTRSNWDTELVQGIIPEKRIIEIPLPELTTEKQPQVSLYNPWTDDWGEEQIINHTVRTDFTRSMVIRLDYGK